MKRNKFDVILYCAGGEFNSNFFFIDTFCELLLFVVVAVCVCVFVEKALEMFAYRLLLRDGG